MKQFLVILVLTALVWLGVSMSETTEYEMTVKVEYTGFDTVRYAVLQADSSVTVSLQSNGFNAILNSINNKDLVLPLPASGNSMHRTVAADVVYDILTERMVGVKSVNGNIDSLRLTLVERQHKDFVPSLDLVEFSFSEQYGLYGRPTVTPEVVTLYGPAEALDKIDRLPVAATTVANISKSGHYRLPLEPVWSAAGDIHASCTEVDIYVPVEPYVEKEYRVPIRVVGADTTVQLRLYPSEATLRVWVAQRDLARVPEFDVTIDYNDITQHKQHIAPQLASFPGYLRPRSLTPEEVQCIIIK